MDVQESAQAIICQDLPGAEQCNVCCPDTEFIQFINRVHNSTSVHNFTHLDYQAYQSSDVDSEYEGASDMDYIIAGYEEVELDNASLLTQPVSIVYYHMFECILMKDNSRNLILPLPFQHITLDVLQKCLTI